MALGAVGQIHISVTDLDRSVAFYRDVLGLPLLFQVPGQSMAFFAAGDVRLYLGVPESPRFRTTVLVYFWVDDIEAEYARLMDRGVTFDSAPHVVYHDDSGDLWMSFFRDPDGHELVLMQERPPAEEV
jgi:catechol 2,3-dioxygenase-like lactoylglutathione lyase family enzyme